MTTLVLGFQKIECDNKAKNDTFYLTLRAETIIKESDINGVF